MWQVIGLFGISRPGFGAWCELSEVGLIIWRYLRICRRIDRIVYVFVRMVSSLSHVFLLGGSCTALVLAQGSSSVCSNSDHTWRVKTKLRPLFVWPTMSEITALRGARNGTDFWRPCSSRPVAHESLGGVGVSFLSFPWLQNAQNAQPTDGAGDFRAVDFSHCRCFEYLLM